MNMSEDCFLQETRRFFCIDQGLPSNDVLALAVDSNGAVVATTNLGVVRFDGANWMPHPGLGSATIDALAFWRGMTVTVRDGAVFAPGDERLTSLPHELGAKHAIQCMDASTRWLLGGTKGLFEIDSEAGHRVIPVDGLNQSLPTPPSIRAIAQDGKRVAVAAAKGLYYSTDGEEWKALHPFDERRSWAPRDVRAVVFDAEGRLWAASPQGVMCCDREETWKLFEGADGLPFNDFTSMTVAANGAVWFGLRKGAIRFDGSEWAYRQGLRWSPADEVRDVVATPDGRVWFATSAGIGCIAFEPITLAQKARFYEDQIDAYHRRTEFEYVMHAQLNRPGDLSEVVQVDSDNDGLWTGMYGAGECFAYAATKDPQAKARARKALDALIFLGEVTQGGDHPAPPGFVARAILPTSGPDPNLHDSPERDRQRQAEQDHLWKIITPRWPVSADGRWYWKSDTSSDELDGHFFLYGCYFDLVAETKEEKQRVRDQVRRVIDHLINNDYYLVDHDGLPTRWGVFNPDALNNIPEWFAERGLNSLSMLSYLAVAAHVTGDKKYREVARTLIDEHDYAQNLLVPKLHNGPGTGNQSDDEMAFMNYYNLIRYEPDPDLRAQYAFSLERYWRMEEPEVNPFFNYIYAACCAGKVYQYAFGDYPLGTAVNDAMVRESRRELERFPLDRVDWRHENSHRLDVARLLPHVHLFEEGAAPHKGYRIDGRVFPVDERHFNFWNHDPWTLDTGGDGYTLADGAAFLLPYYMGLYHGFVPEAHANNANAPQG